MNRIPKKAISCNFLSSSQKEGKKHRKKGEGELRKLNEIENYFTDGLTAFGSNHVLDVLDIFFSIEKVFMYLFTVPSEYSSVMMN